jgi:hypothetical protein
MIMSPDDREKLRSLATALLSAPTGLWELQTSNSFRRIGTPGGDGNVLCATKQRSDGHPDLLAASVVLSYIIASQPRAVLDLLDQIETLGKALGDAIAICDQFRGISANLERLKDVMHLFASFVDDVGNDSDDMLRDKAKDLVVKATAMLKEITQ